jgi:hypothetical protein
MKRFSAVVALSALFSVAAFAVLVAADRQFGVPLPYSIPLSFTIVSIVAPAAFALANAVRRRLPARVIPVTPRPAVGFTAPVKERRQAEGVVLLDLSNARTLKEQAA